MTHVRLKLSTYSQHLILRHASEASCAGY